MLSRAFSRVSRSVAHPMRRAFSSDVPKASSVVSESLRQASENSFVANNDSEDRRRDISNINNDIHDSRIRSSSLGSNFGGMDREGIDIHELSRRDRELLLERRQMRNAITKVGHEFPIDSFETPETVREKGRNIEVLTRWEAVEMLSCAKKRQGLNWKEIAKRLDASEAYVASIFLGQQSVDKETANKLMEVLEIKDSRIRDGLSLVLRQAPLRGLHLHSIEHSVGGQVADPFLHRLKEINMMWNVVIKALVHEKLGDGVMSASDFGLDVSTMEKGNGNQFVKITMCGKFEPFRKF